MKLYISIPGWTILISVAEATKLPDGRKCPAFALALRNTTTTTTLHPSAGIVVRYL